MQTFGFMALQTFVRVLMSANQKLSLFMSFWLAVFSGTFESRPLVIVAGVHWQQFTIAIYVAFPTCDCLCNGSASSFCCYLPSSSHLYPSLELLCFFRYLVAMECNGNQFSQLFCIILVLFILVLQQIKIGI